MHLAQPERLSAEQDRWIGIGEDSQRGGAAGDDVTDRVGDIRGDEPEGGQVVGQWRGGDRVGESGSARNRVAIFVPLQAREGIAAHDRGETGRGQLSDGDIGGLTREVGRRLRTGLTADGINGGGTSPGGFIESDAGKRLVRDTQNRGQVDRRLIKTRVAGGAFSGAGTETDAFKAL